MVKILDGRKLSTLRAENLIEKIKRLKEKPKLIIIQIGDRKESNTYINRKKSFGERIGVEVLHKKYPETVSEGKIISDISKFNKDKRASGIMVQLPLVKRLNTHKILDSIRLEKDVDGLKSQTIFMPATARGIVSLLEGYKIRVEGKKVAVVGDSELVGRPTALALLDRGATVTICNKNTKNLKKETKQADMIIVATGRGHLITRAHVSKNQIVIDVGISLDKDGKIVGDVDFKRVSKIVKAITPVPGGVGPMTVLSLFENLLEAYNMRNL